MSRACTLLGALVLLATAPRIAAAQEDGRDAARALYLQGIELASAERWPEALAAFEGALRNYEHPNVVRAVAATLERMGRFIEAAEAHNRWLQLSSEPPESTARAEAERLRELDLSRIAHLTLSVTPASARLLIDGNECAPGQLPLDPGSHVVEVSAEGFDSTEFELTLREGHSTERSIELRRHEIEPELEAAAPRTSTQRRPVSAPPAPFDEAVLGWTLTGTGAAFLVAAAAMLAHGLDLRAQVEHAPEGSHWSALEPKAELSPVLVATGVAASAVGLALSAAGLGLTIASEASRPSLSLEVSLRGASLTGSF